MYVLVRFVCGIDLILGQIGPKSPDRKSTKLSQIPSGLKMAKTRFQQHSLSGIASFSE